MGRSPYEGILGSPPQVTTFALWDCRAKQIKLKYSVEEWILELSEVIVYEELYHDEENQQKHTGEASFKIKRTAASVDNVRWVNSSILVITQWNLFTLFVCENEI